MLNNHKFMKISKTTNGYQLESKSGVKISKNDLTEPEAQALKSKIEAYRLSRKSQMINGRKRIKSNS